MAIPGDAPDEPWIFLLGRPPIEEYLSFVVQASPGQNLDIAALAAQWRSAADVVDQLASSESGAADGRTTAPLPQSLAPRASAYLNEPAVRATYALIPPRIELVSLDDLVVFQKQINVRYVRELQAFIGDSPQIDEQLLAFCLADEQPEPAIQRMQTSTNSFAFKSASTDARFLGATILDADQISQYVPSGRARYAVTIYIGYGVNALNVISINGRLMLNNGSHRAYALKACGLTHVPALIQDITREDELAVIPAVQQNKELYLQHPRPPMLRDYFNESLYQQIQVPRRARQIRVQFGIEQLDGPA